MIFFIHHKIKNNIIDNKLMSKIYFIVINSDFFVSLLDYYFETEHLWRYNLYFVLKIFLRPNYCSWNFKAILRPAHSYQE